MSEVLLPLLAARGWAPWPVEPRTATERRADEWRPATAGYGAIWRDGEERRPPCDDVQ